MANWTRPLSLLALVIGLAACATTKQEVIPQDGPDMATIYRHHLRGAGVTRDPARQGGARPIASGVRDLHGDALRAAGETDRRFPLLPNPQMVLYVFAHLSTEGAPVPGYSTVFPLYAVDRYAMPGEVHQP